jgi:hypothetical protein
MVPPSSWVKVLLRRRAKLLLRRFQELPVASDGFESFSSLVSIRLLCFGTCLMTVLGEAGLAGIRDPSAIDMDFRLLVDGFLCCLIASGMRFCSVLRFNVSIEPAGEIGSGLRSISVFLTLSLAARFDISVSTHSVFLFAARLRDLNRASGKDFFFASSCASGKAVVPGEGVLEEVIVVRTVARLGRESAI